MSRWLAMLQDPRLVVALPTFFFAGYLLQDHLVTAAEFRVLEAERVSKRMGTWAPPPLTDSERASLMAERAECLRDVEQLTGRLTRPR